MSEKRSWDSETVPMDQAREEPASTSRRKRTGGWHPPSKTHLLSLALLVVAVIATTGFLISGGTVQKEPRLKPDAPKPTAATAQPHARTWADGRRSIAPVSGSHEGSERRAHGRDLAEPMPEEVVTPAPELPAEPQPSIPPPPPQNEAPSEPAPTPPSVEFGL